MPDDDNRVENRIQKAVEAYNNNQKLKILPLSHKFNVPYQQLQARINGRKTLSQLAANGRKLSDSQEAAVKEWIEHMDRNNCPPTTEQIQDTANSILQRHHTDPSTPPPQVSKMWTYQFIQRLDGYRRVKQKAMDPKRLQVEDISYMRVWFDHLEILYTQYHFHACDIYNFDEIGFQEGQGQGE